MAIVPSLLEHGARVQCHDPEAMPAPRSLLPDVVFCENPYDACNSADAAVLMTEWNEYRAMDLIHIKQRLHSPVFVDLRNVYDPTQMQSLGFDYFSIGRCPDARPVCEKG